MRSLRFFCVLWSLATFSGACRSVQTRQIDAEFNSLLNRLQYLHDNAIEEQSMYDSVSARLRLVLEDTAVLSNYENQLAAANYIRLALATKCSAEIVQPSNQQPGAYRYAIRMYCPKLSSPAIVTLQSEGLQFASGDAIIATKVTPLGELWFRADFLVREFERPKPQVILAARYRSSESLALLKQAFGLKHQSTIRIEPGVLVVPTKVAPTHRSATEAGTIEVFFVQGSSILSAQARTALDALKIPQGARVQIFGHSNKSERSGDDLSRERAVAVLQYLKQRFPHARYRYRSFGSRKPGYPHKSADAARLNRRAAVRVVAK